ncbi:UNKNOWN [Stylonychia lemnae]|uniref:peptide-methionine (R)-S-oxide reductase n=1 Tax=Stylonychia lemnae TaxID=5949 RepID=A0A078A426_STYLE|nr:UNKNOWN [Stylonychia lemnae]|eukprot:CDW77023.1 UNKNOWN [Stylonychia lemnae]
MPAQIQYRQFGIFDKIFKKKEPEVQIKIEEPPKKITLKEQLQDEKERQIESELRKQAEEEVQRKQLESFTVQKQVDERDQVILNLENMQQSSNTTATQTSKTQETPQRSIELDNRKYKKLLNRVKSIQDAYYQAKVNADGTVSHLIVKNIDGSPKTFKDVAAFHKWVKTSLKERAHKLQTKLTPYQYYITQNQGTERPFTSEYWWTKDAGVYSCVVCSQKLFMSDHKYEVPTGHATFWNHIIDSVEYLEDNLKVPKVTNAFVDTLYKNKIPIKRCVCSMCEAHLGHIYNDGVAPYFKRFSINSASVIFTPKPWAKQPTQTNEEKLAMRRRVAQTKYGLSEFNSVIEHAKLLGIQSYLEKTRPVDLRNKSMEAQSEEKRAEKKDRALRYASRVASNEKKEPKVKREKSPSSANKNQPQSSPTSSQSDRPRFNLKGAASVSYSKKSNASVNKTEDKGSV